MFCCVRHFVAHCALFWRVSFGVYLLVIFVDSFTCVDAGAFRPLLLAYIKVFGNRIFIYPLKTNFNQNYRNSVGISNRTPTVAINKADLLTILREIIGV